MLFSLFEEPGRGGDIQEQYVYVPPPPPRDIEKEGEERHGDGNKSVQEVVSRISKRTTARASHCLVFIFRPQHDYDV